MTRCHVCHHPIPAPFYEAGGSAGITSLCEVLPHTATRVFFCDRCGHVQTHELADLAAYYDQAYQILIDSEDEDQIYRVVDGRPVFRIDHQVATLLDKLALPTGARVLDYGCAKSATMRKLLLKRPDLKPHLFDVSEMYVPFWRRFVPDEVCATYAPRPEWLGSFDAVTSFFALEHVLDPQAFCRTIHGLLKPDGLLYLIVPNVAVNTADFVVVDHVNHFTETSMGHLLAVTGFEPLAIDAGSHFGAYVVVARRLAAPVAPPEDAAGVASTRRTLEAIRDDWQGAGERVRDFEAAHRGAGPVAVYGSGFYGTFIAACLVDASAIACFIDQNPYRQGKRLFDRPVLGPEQLPAGVRVVYVGLNPRTARASIAEVAAWRDRALQYFYL